MITKQDLIDFEDQIAADFAAKRIAAPIHLSGGNEDQLIEYFGKYVRPSDWILTSWRSHLHALLKGVPRDEVRNAILRGRSISLCFPKYNMLSSGIVGGTGPIAIGIAKGIKMRRGEEKVHLFLGDMTARTGIIHECMEYARGHALLIRFVTENNGMSICTDTKEAWGKGTFGPYVTEYSYKNSRPHVGIGEWIRF